MLVKYPKSSPLLMGAAILVGLAVAAFIVHMVFTFAWFASGLAGDKADAQQRREQPIDVEFQAPADPNA